MQSVLPVPESVLLQSIQEYNILPLTSLCNVRCVFCSHQQNPPGVEVFSLPPRDREQVLRSAGFLDAGKKIVIGESATRIIEGEPCTHPDFLAILQGVRKRFPATPIQLTTNGALLTSRLVTALAHLAPLEINLSLNSADPPVRARLMGDREAARAVAAPILLKEADVPFHGSIVAMPWMTGWEDLRQTVRCLESRGAQTIRVFLPGFTRLAPPDLRFPPGLWEELDRNLRELADTLRVPVTLDPPLLTDLAAVLEGVVHGSPALTAGLKRGDVILEVQGTPVTCRVDAFRRVRRCADPQVLVERDGSRWETSIAKQPGATSGLVMSSDFDPELPGLVERAARRHRARRVLLLCSQPGERVLRLGLAPLAAQGLELFLQPAASRFFGGSIVAAGLLVTSDLLAAFHQFQDSHPGVAPELVLVPAIAFDHRGRDLTGRPVWDLQDAVSCPVVAL